MQAPLPFWAQIEGHAFVPEATKWLFFKKGGAAGGGLKSNNHYRVFGRTIPILWRKRHQAVRFAIYLFSFHAVDFAQYRAR